MSNDPLNQPFSDYCYSYSDFICCLSLLFPGLLEKVICRGGGAKQTRVVEDVSLVLTQNCFLNEALAADYVVLFIQVRSIPSVCHSSNCRFTHFLCWAPPPIVPGEGNSPGSPRRGSISPNISWVNLKTTQSSFNAPQYWCLGAQFTPSHNHLEIALDWNTVYIKIIILKYPQDPEMLSKRLSSGTSSPCSEAAPCKWPLSFCSPGLLLLALRSSFHSQKKAKNPQKSRILFSFPKSQGPTEKQDPSFIPKKARNPQKTRILSLLQAGAIAKGCSVSEHSAALGRVCRRDWLPTFLIYLPNPDFLLCACREAWPSPPCSWHRKPSAALMPLQAQGGEQEAPSPFCPNFTLSAPNSHKIHIKTFQSVSAGNTILREAK